MSGPQPLPADPSEASAASKLEKANEYVYTVDLPSKGKFYGDRCPKGTVDIRPLTGRDESLFAGMNTNNLSEVFDEVLSRCLLTDIPLDELLTTDKFYLMLMLRANSYGDLYEFRARCPHCGFYQSVSCRIPGDFEVSHYDKEEIEPFMMELPKSKTMVELRLLRGKDDREVVAWRDRELERNSKQLGDPAHSYQMAKHIVSIDGHTPPNIGEAIKFFDNLIAMDASAITTFLDDYTSGVNTELAVNCSRCGTSSRTDMPFTAGFFRTQRGSLGESP